MGNEQAPKQIGQSGEVLAYRDRRVNVDGTFTFHYGKLSIEQQTVTVQHITPEAAKAMVEQAHQMYAVPAQEATKQAQEKTRQTQEMTKWETQFTLRHALVFVGVILMALLTYANPTIGPVMGGMAVVLGGVYLGSTYLEKKSQARQLPENDKPKDDGET